MNSKQRAYLRSLSSTISPIFQVGKNEISPELVEGINQALEARELIKIHVLKNCFTDPKEIANTIAERTHSQVVHVIGKMIVLYRVSKDNPKISLEIEG